MLNIIFFRFGHYSVVHTSESQVKGIIKLIKEAHKKRLGWVEVKQEAVTEYNAWIQEGLKKTVWHQDRKAWYNNADGVNIALWPFTATYQGIVYAAAPDWTHFHEGRKNK
jgi:hypothetical protein